VKYEPKHLEIEYVMESHYIEKLHFHKFHCIRQIKALGENGLLLANIVTILVNVGFVEYNGTDLVQNTAAVSRKENGISLSERFHPVRDTLSYYDGQGKVDEGWESLALLFTRP
jgi:hypothetical protein